MTAHVNEHNLAEELMRAFPELEDRYREEVVDCEGQRPSNYAVVGFVFKPRLKAELETGAITDFLKRASQFIEQVCVSGDPEAVNVIWIKLFEWLLVHPPELRLLWPLLGPSTKAAIRDAATRWNSVAVLPD